MKYLTTIALLGSLSVYAQNFSPSASGTSITSPSGSIAPGTGGIQPSIGTPNSLAPQGAGTTLNPTTPNSTYNNSPVDVGGIPNNNFNTAPTNVPSGQPSDTTLLNTSPNIPSNNPPAQAQEFNTFPDNTISPGNSGSDFGTGSGSDVNNNIYNGNSPVSNP